MIKEKKMYWDEDILRIKNEVRRHNREGINDEETAEADAEPDETTEETKLFFSTRHNKLTNYNGVQGRKSLPGVKRAAPSCEVWGNAPINYY